MGVRLDSRGVVRRVGLVLALGLVVVVVVAAAGCGDDGVTGDTSVMDAAAVDSSTVDVVAPVAGSGMAFSALNATSLTVGWGAATDDVTDAVALRYKVVRASSSDAIDTLAEVAAITSGGALVLDFTANTLTVDVASLTPATGYAFAVVVEDAAGNKTLYAPATVTTLDVGAPTVGTGITFASIAATSVTVNWGAASDDVTAASALQYKLVRAATALELDTLAEIAAISGPALVMNFTADTTTAPVTGLASSTGYAFAVVVKDAAGNEALYAPAAVTTLDNSDPTVTITGPTASATSTTTAASIALAGSASDNVAVASVTWANAANATSGTATGTTAWSVASVTLAAGDNVITVTATDGAGNTATDTITVTRDNTDPTVTITSPTATATFTTASSSIALAGSASDNVAVASVTWANAASATSGTATGTTAWSVAALTLAAGVNIITVTATDNAGNTATDTITVTRDNTAPTVTINQASGQADPTNGSPISFTVVFSEPVTGFTSADVATTGSTATVGTITVTGGPSTYNVEIAATGNGTVIATVVASAAQDAAANNSVASTSTDNTVTLDTGAPTVTINQAVGQADPTSGPPISFTVVFSEPVAGFTSADVATTGSTATVGTITVTGGPSTYNVAIAATGNGTVIATVVASAAQDAAANNSAASTSTDNTVTLDTSNYTVGGSVTGLYGSSLVLALNGSATNRVTLSPPSQAVQTVSFTFPSPLPNGTPYTISVVTQPTAFVQTCSLGAQTSGTIASANISDAALSCGGVTLIRLSGSGGSIPDGLANICTSNNPGAALTSSINIAGNHFSINRVTVTLTSLNHTWVGDLSASLRRDASATTVSLFDRIGNLSSSPSCGSAARFNGTYTMFDTALSDLWSATITGAATGYMVPGGDYYPYAANQTRSFLDAASPTGFKNQTTAGNWSLRLVDNNAQDTGSIAGWTLELSP